MRRSWLLVVVVGLAACRIGFDHTPSGDGGAGDDSLGPLPALPPARLALGDNFSCALHEDGNVTCWGASYYRQLGRDDLRNRALPATVETLGATIVKLDAGGNSACAIDRDGAVWCWGENSRGALGNGTVAEVTVPVRALLPSAAVEISVGAGHACAILEDRALWCWGDNQNGAVGRDPQSEPVHAAPVSVLGDVSMVTAGFAHTCALRGDGGVWCWGWNAYGQLGDNTGDHYDARQVPGLVAVGVYSFYSTVCALVDGGFYRCWGNNSNGQIGYDSVQTTNPLPGPVSTVGGFERLALGSDHTCGITVGGEVLCWGDNDWGELGNATTFDTNAPTPVSLGGGALDVGAGGRHACAIRTDKRVACWGRRAYGELGDGALSPRTPQPVALPASAMAVAAGSEHACAIVGSAGEVYCWGYNVTNQLGASTPVQEVSSAVPLLVAGVSGATQVAAGYRHSCARIGTTSLMCWGANYAGQIGLGTTSYSENASTVTVPAPVTGVAIGADFTCAAANGSTYCWGDNYYYQLGTSMMATPMPRNIGLTATSVWSGWYHACAVDGAGSAQCWGWDNYGQVGNDAPGIQQLPAPIAGTYSMISGGYAHTCAVTGAAIHCWGANSSGQLGDGTIVLHGTPGATLLTGGATAIAAGGDTSCAIVGGAVQCFGGGSSGALGDGTNAAAQITPVPTGITNATALSVGGGFACAVASGVVYCWGDNTYGQTGTGPLGITLSPVDVLL